MSDDETKFLGGMWSESGSLAPPRYSGRFDRAAVIDAHVTTGQKSDTDKPRWDLLPVKAVKRVVGVLTYGAKKYAPDNWKKVPQARDRYYRAAIGHINDWWDGERLDPESGHHHLAHACCCILFLIWFEEVGYP